MSGVLITGANGFVGAQLCERLKQRISIRAVVRNTHQAILKGVETLSVDNIGPNTNWHGCLDDINTVIHLAARVHVMQDRSPNPLDDFRETNVEGTRRLAEHAAKAGVKRFIFVSTIKVNGEITLLNQPFTAEDTPAPQEPYGYSKMEAEHALRKVSEETGLEIVIIRPPLVYGPGVKANFESLLRTLTRKIPLPLGAIRNRRSLVGLDNLIDLIITCMDHPAASNQTFLVSDGEDLSTPDLIERLATAMGQPARLFSVPPAMLIAGASLIGKREMAHRLCSSLQIDISKTCALLGWRPPESVDIGLAKVAHWYIKGIS